MATRPALPAVLTILVLGGLLSACADDRHEDLVNGKTWFVTVYYTAVEQFHDGTETDVLGCPGLECANGNEPLGRYPQGFVTTVRDEGSGRITSGEHSGKYLNWSYDIGYWLDEAPRDAHGRPLRPFRSAAADGLPDGMRLRLVDCGKLDSGQPVPRDVCEPLRDAEWEIRDRFTPGLGGERHIDLYIGEETHAGFTASGRLYVALQDSVFAAGD